MSFNAFINEYSQAARIFQEVAQKKATVLRRTDGGLRFMSRETGLSPNAVKLVRGFKRTPDVAEVLAIGRALAEGPKIFRPKQLDFEMLEQIAVNISFTDYVQPFDTIVIELPVDYLAKKIVHCPHAGQYVYGTKQPEMHSPTMVIVQHWPDVNAILTMLSFSSGVSIKTIFAPKTDETVEEYINSFSRKDEFDDCLETTDEEWELTHNVIRAALNFCLLVDEVGARRVGSDNPSHHRRLAHFVDVAKKRNDPAKLRRAQAELIAHPVVYELNQEVELYRTVDRDEDLGPHEDTGRVMPPHHRRGHYRMQPHGPNNSLRKRRRIKAVFVNKHLFLGNMANARATYSS